MLSVLCQDSIEIDSMDDGHPEYTKLDKTNSDEWSFCAPAFILFCTNCNIFETYNLSKKKCLISMETCEE